MKDNVFKIFHPRHGKEVWVSDAIEKVRRDHCLCVGSCRRLKGNIRLQNALKEHYGEEDAKEALAIMARESFLRMTSNGVEAEINANDKYCPLALVIYHLCVIGDMALAAGRCLYYVAPEQESDES